MKKIINICYALFLLSIITLGLYFDGETCINSEKFSLSVKNSDLCLYISCLLGVIFILIKAIFVLKDKFTRSRNTEAIINDLQDAISSILLKDVKSAEKNLGKLKKNVKNIAILNWLEGNIELLKSNLHKAKSLFYLASSAEEKSSLGVYSLCKLAVQMKDQNAEIETLQTILNKSGFQENIAIRLLTICLIKNDFVNANYYMDLIKSHKKLPRIDAIVKFSEASLGSINEENLLKSAHDSAPEIVEIAIKYSKLLTLNQQPRKAKNVLEKTWKLSPHPLIFEAYIDFADDIITKIESAYELVSMQTNTWVGYFEYGKLLLDNGKIEDVFCNFLAAYGKCRYKFVYDLLYKVCELLPDPKPSAALEILSKKHDKELIDVKIVWQCSNCGSIHDSWQPICSHCESIDTIAWMAKNSPSNCTAITIL